MFLLILFTVCFQTQAASEAEKCICHYRFRREPTGSFTNFFIKSIKIILNLKLHFFHDNPLLTKK